MRHLLTACVAVFLCACSLTPEYCRSLGVDVPDGAVQTGVVTEYDHCEPCAGNDGCAKQVGVDKWEVYSCGYWVRQHEFCHALYQRMKHGKPE
jgi:hypothetical protein